MKKGVKITLIVLAILVGFVLIDTLQALLFNNNPIIGMEMWCKKRSGILVDTYHCDNGNITKFKFTNYFLETSCTTNVICGK